MPDRGGAPYPDLANANPLEAKAPRPLITSLKGACPMSMNSFGHLFRVTTWGESHGPSPWAQLSMAARRV